MLHQSKDLRANRLMQEKNSFFLSFLSLFTSLSTLLCCALPALLITLGLGAVMAGLVSNFPIIITLSKYKIWLFLAAGFLLIASGILLKRANNMPCPADKNKAYACIRLRKINKIIYILSLTAFLIGAFFAFGAKYLSLMNLLEILA
jgi:hypothetical protein